MVSRKTLSYSRIGAAYSAWWLLWIGEQAFLVNRAGFNWDLALTDAAISQLLLAVSGYAINTSMHYYQPSQKNSVYVLIWSLALAAGCTLLQQWLIAQAITDASYLMFLSQSLLIRALFNWLMIVMIAILTWFWVYVNDRQESEQRKEDAARLAREAELSNLRTQLQPHFLFNSLNSISALIGTQPEKARTMIQQLSDFLRGTVKKAEHQLVSLEEEMQHLQLYLDIEKVRFGHRLSVVVRCDEDSFNLRLPSLLLQPIVENAIKFGLYDTVDEITISIAARSDLNNLVIEVKNPFDPSTAPPKSGTGFGLNSIKRRLLLLYSQGDLLTTRQENNIFVTSIKIPQSV